MEDLGTLSSSTPISSGDRKEVENLNGDAHTEKLAKVASGTKSRRKRKDKAGAENPQTKMTQTKKTMTPEIVIPQQGNGHGEWRKSFKGKKLNLETSQSEPPMKLSGGKQIKRKQALEDSPPQRNEVLAPAEKKKRRRKEKLGDGPKLMEGAKVPEFITGTVSLDRVAFEPVRHFWNDDDEEEFTVVYRRPAVPNVKKSRVRRRKKSGIGPINLESPH